MTAVVETNDSTPRRTQAERRAATRVALLNAARELFVKKGFAQTGTPEIVATAGVTRGALYHQFEGKKGLFHAVATREAEQISAAIRVATSGITGAQEALIAGALAYFDAATTPGSSEILLVQAPAVLGHEAATALTFRAGGTELHGGLRVLHPTLTNDDLAALTDILSAAFDRAALALANGAPRLPYERMVMNLIRSSTDPATSQQRRTGIDAATT